MNRAAPLLAAVVVLAAGAACADTPTARTPTSPSRHTVSPQSPQQPVIAPTPTQPTQAAPDCVTRKLQAMTARQKAAQLVMVGVRSTGLTGQQRAVLRKHKPGGVLLIGGAAGAATALRTVRAAVQAVGADRPLVAADQEGGRVQRLKGSGFSAMPSAEVQSQWPARTLTSRASGWARQLRSAGVHIDLAPVADVVPAGTASRNAPVGALDRGYGADPDRVGADVAAFVRGMRAGGVSTAIKHFPGLGRVRGNTDFTAGVVDRTTVRRDAALEPFAAGIAAGSDLVMVSTATYPRIDKRRRAVFSPTVIGQMLRGDLKFGGVVISDDLGAAAEVASVPAGERAARFVRAGGDLVITVTPGTVAPMIDALVKTAPDLDQHVRRVLVLKQKRGLLACR